MKLSKNFTEEPYSFLANDTTLASKNPSQFGKKLLENDY